MARHEKMWRCSSCQKENWGRHIVCQFCSHPRPIDVDFYRPGEEGQDDGPNTIAHTPVVTDPVLLQQAAAGPDWYCRHCGAGNRNLDADDQPVLDCSQCGALRNEPKATESVPDHRPLPQYAETSAQMPADPPSLPFEPTVRFPSFTLPSDVAKWALGALLIVGLFVGGCWLLQTREVPVTVVGFSWNRSISVEIYKTVREGGWNVPSGGRQIGTEQRVSGYNHVIDHYDTEHYTEQVLTGYHDETYYTTESYADGEYVCGSRDTGNGYEEDVYCTSYSERQVEHTTSVADYEAVDRTREVPVYRDDPIYSTWYTYDIEKWVFSRNLDTSANDHNAEWANDKLLNNEREAFRTDGYRVKLEAQDGKIYTASIGLGQWSGLLLEQKLTAKINRLGIVVSVKEFANVEIEAQ